MDSTISSTLQELVKFIKAVSPELWRIATKQVQVNVIVDSVWCFIFIVVAIILGKVAYKAYKDDQYDVSGAATIGGTIVLIFGLIVLTTSVIPTLLNPEYYTIKVLMSILGK